MALTGTEIGADMMTDLRDRLAAAGLPTDDLAEPGRRFFAFALGAMAVGHGGFEDCGEVVLLRSIVVEPAMRGRGLGRAIVTALLDTARHAGHRQAFLLTDTARPFFEANGFVVVDRRSAPASIAATRQFAQLCPASAVLMERAL